MTKHSFVEETPGDPARPEHKASFTWLHDLYRVLWKVVGPLLPAYLRRRARRGKEDPQRLTERFGIASRSRPGGDLLWIHGASVGESLSALPLVEHLLDQREDLHILFTTGTLTSAELLETRLPERAFHQYVPLDHPRYVAQFLDHWQPDAVFWLESEFWPNLLRGVGERRIRAALLNARLSDRSFKRWLRRPGFIVPVLGGFSLCLAQDDGVATKLKQLGAPQVSALGNLKFATPPLPDNARERSALEDMIADRPVVLAAQTAAGEEVMLGKVFRELQDPAINLLLIVVPRHPDRGDAIRDNMEALGLRVATRSRGEAINDQIDIYLADTMGELGTFYRLEALVVLGRSLIPGHGGSNLLEPARFNRCIVQGPWTENFAAMNTLFEDAQASLVVEGEEALKETLARLLNDRGEVARIGSAGNAISLSAASVVERVAGALMPLLPSQPEPNKGNIDARS